MSTSQQSEGQINIDKVNELVESLLRRLKGGLHGEFYEEGSKLGNNKRLEQLPVLFELVNALNALKRREEVQVDASESVTNSKNKKATPPNTNMIATIKDVVQGELSGVTRDLSIANERLSERLDKAEGAKEGMQKQMKALESKVKKSNERNQEFSSKLTQAESVAISARSTAEKQSTDLEYALTEISRMSSRCDDLDRKLKDAEAKRDADHKSTQSALRGPSAHEQTTAFCPSPVLAAASDGHTYEGAHSPQYAQTQPFYDHNRPPYGYRRPGPSPQPPHNYHRPSYGYRLPAPQPLFDYNRPAYRYRQPPSAPLSQGRAHPPPAYGPPPGYSHRRVAGQYADTEYWGSVRAEDSVYYS